jgi:uncharacterized phage protein gp47/JayE
MTLLAVIDQFGVSAPSYDEILTSLQNSYRSIYGADIYIEPDSQDAQFLAILAILLKDKNDSTIAVYNAFSPSTAQGVGLSSVVKINGIRRLVPTFSSAVVTLVGSAGTVINGGVVGDTIAGSMWNLPATVVIPLSGEIDVTAICITAGAILAGPNTITRIMTPTPGWQTATNPASAIPGAPVETDALLRRRQTRSTSISAITPREAIYASIADIAGVQRLSVFDNSQSTADADGVPPHSIAVVVEGGDLSQIAAAIARTKSPGTGTYGSSKFIVFDSKGVPNTINLTALSLVPVHFRVNIVALPGYVSTTGTLIINTVAQYLNEREIHETLYSGRLWSPANLNGTAATDATGLPQTTLDQLSNTYVVKSVEIGRASDAMAETDLVINFNEASYGDVNNGSISVVASV